LLRQFCNPHDRIYRFQIRGNAGAAVGCFCPSKAAIGNN
jgi:hypothetical protein